MLLLESIINLIVSIMKKSNIVNLNIKDEIQFFINDKKAKQATNINFHTIKHLKQQGKILRPALMKNNLIGYVIQSPVWFLYEKGDINNDQFAAGLKYNQDCTLANLDNMSKQTYDGLPMSPSSKPSNKEPKQRQLDAAKRVYEVKKYFKIRGQHINIRILDLFFEQEKTITYIKAALRVGHKRIKEVIIEALDLMVNNYKKHENSNKQTISRIRA